MSHTATLPVRLTIGDAQVDAGDITFTPGGDDLAPLLAEFLRSAADIISPPAAPVTAEEATDAPAR